MEPTSDGGIIVTGFVSSSPYAYTQVYLIKTDAAGIPSWTRTYGGPMNDYGRCVREVPGGGYVVAGRYEANSQTFDAYLIRTKASGDLIWQRRYDLGDDERAHAVCATPDGGFLLAGQAWIGDALFGSYDVWLVKTDANGNLEWQRTYHHEASGADVALSVEPTNDGGFIVGGFTQSSVWASYVIRIDAGGTPLWERTYDVQYQNECYSVQPLADGTFVLTGARAPSGDSDVMLTRLASNGDVIWMRSYGGANDDNGQSVRQMPDGGFVVTGMTASGGAGMWDVYVVRTDPQGSALWTQTYGGSSDDRGFSVRPAADGGVLVAGWAWSFGAGLGDAYLLKIRDGASTGVASGAVSERRPLIVLNAWPNPSRGPATVDLELDRSGWTRVDVFDAAGRRVRALADRPFAAGRHALAWDGRDEDGRLVASGVYFVRAGLDGTDETRRLAVLR